MKGKNSTWSRNPSSFALKESFLSYKDHSIICLISILIGIGYSASSIPLKFKWSLTVAQDSTLLALFVLREVITICVFALMPVLLVFYLILTYLLKKKIQQLEEVIQKRGKTTNQQNNLPKNDREKISRFFIVFLCFILLFEVFFTAAVVMLILEFYYFVFKRVRMYCRVKRQLKCVKKKA
ncbi:hypothetical protein [Bartonella queenslandensis]|uniref:hypothetical protein n=1 Tax=Bartonella queenslandensis TaxID=481138 RepID=UPI0002D667BF|nr:hypothetical protein [Bartonella queenslandensis]